MTKIGTDCTMLSFDRVILCGAWLICGACGGQTELDSAGTDLGGTTSGTGGTGAVETGGARVAATGGTWLMATGGTWVASTGGTRVMATGGARPAEGGGTGVAATGATAGALSCGGVTCASIPTSCTGIVQDRNACCPTCTDTGCSPCGDLVCASGTHSATAVGACCPACVTDKPDACTQGQQNYTTLRTELLDKYSSLGCNNSTDCAIVQEDNFCAASCGIALPKSMSSSFENNLNSAALSDCATCPTPVPPPCPTPVPACVNGQCVSAIPL